MAVFGSGVGRLFKMLMGTAGVVAAANGESEVLCADVVCRH